MLDVINEFKDEYRWLSNFWLASIVLNEEKYDTVEHYYQSQKASTEEDRRDIAGSLTPGRAKYLGQRIKLRDDWEDVKDLIMYEGVLAKFTQNLDLSEKLLSTGEQEIVEGNTWGDTYWGVCNGNGKNKLGKILMSVREHLSYTHPGFMG